MLTAEKVRENIASHQEKGKVKETENWKIMISLFMINRF